MMIKNFVLLIICVVGTSLSASNAQILPCDANELVVQNTCIYNSYNIVSTTQTVMNSLMPTCGNYQNGGQWFHLTYPEQGQSLQLDFQSSDPSFQPGLAIYLGDCNNLNLTDCVDNATLGVDLSTIIDDGCDYFYTGMDVWIFVWNTNGSITTNYDLCATAVQPNAVDTDISCFGLPKAGNFCCDAPVFNLCDLNNFCSETSGLFFGDQPAAFCGDLENNQWIGFIAEDNMIQIEIEVGSCLLQNGLQAQIYQTNDCNFFVPVSPCYNNAIPTSIVTISTGLIPGDVYYLMIDGWGADICDFELNVVDGLSSVDVPESGDTICFGESLPLTVNTTGMGINNIYWTADVGLNDVDPLNPIVTPTQNTTYYMHIEGNACDTLLEVPIFVRPEIGNVNWNLPTSLCPGDSLFINFTFPDNGLYDISFSDNNGMYNFEAVDNAFVYSTYINTDNHFEFLSVTDVYGCQKDLNLVSDVIILPSWDTLSIEYTCLPSGAYTADITFDSEGLVISGFTGTQMTSHFVTDPIANNSLQTIHVVDVNDCKSLDIDLMHSCACSDDFKVVLAETNSIECAGDNTAQIESTIMNGFGNLTYQWNTNASTAILSDLGPGTYMLTVTDQAACSTADTIVVQDVMPMSFDIISDADPCGVGESGVLTFDNISGGNGPYVYSINGLDYMTDSIFTTLSEGVYNTYIMDQNGCVVEQGAELSAASPFLVSVSGNTSVQLGETINLALTSTNTLDSIVWNSTFYEDCIICDQYIVEPHGSSVYNVQAWDVNGCMSESQISVDIFNNEEAFIPNVFTPNFDGVNDYLSVFGGSSIKDVLSYTIFNRWGEVVFKGSHFKINDLSAGWDGRYNGQNVNPGVYLYSIEVLLKDGTTQLYSGDVTLVR